jgi:hypothetical protein
LRRAFVAVTAMLWACWASAGHARIDPSPLIGGPGTEITLLALNMYHEARGEGSVGMLAVGWVVLNRLRDETFPATVPDVILQGAEGGVCQFEWLCDDLPTDPRNGRAWRRAVELARMLLGDYPPPDPTGGAVWFRTTSLAPPNWGIPVVETARIGNHVFYGRPGVARKGPPVELAAIRPLPKPERQPERLAMSMSGSASSVWIPRTRQ